MAFPVKLNAPELQLRRRERDSLRLNHRAECVSAVYAFKVHLLHSPGAAVLNNTVKDGEMIHSAWFLDEILSTPQALSSV